MDDLTRVIDLATFLPPVSRDSKDMRELMRIESVELQSLWEDLCGIFYNQFIATMTGYGLRQWEAIFDVIPKATDSFQDRRQRILQLLLGTRPYTVLSFQAILDRVYGEGVVTIHVNNDKYEFWMDISGGMLSKANEIRAFAETIVPKNLLLLIKNVKTVAAPIRIGGIVSFRSAASIAADVSVRKITLQPIARIGGMVFIKNIKIKL